MITTVVIGVCVITLAAVLWYARRAGKDAARVGAAEETLDAIRDATKPATDAELKRVRDTFRRD